MAHHPPSRIGSALGALTIAGLLVGLATTRASTPRVEFVVDAVAVTQGSPAVTAPTIAPAPRGAGVAATPDPRWVARTSALTGVPPRAMQAYAAAQLRSAAEAPGCRLSWPTLAGIGYVESHHGSWGGATLGADGVARPPIVGVALDGSGPVATIGDTDAGALDGDPRWDRAVGPMQFLPSSWARLAVDADADGRADPQDIDDAALAAARHLCANGGDLTTDEGWRQAVLDYNPSAAYLSAVSSAASAYARRSQQ